MTLADNIKKIREDKSSALNEKDKTTVMNIIDTMLTKQRFQTFFEQNLATK